MMIAKALESVYSDDNDFDVCNLKANDIDVYYGSLNDETGLS